MRTPVVLAYFAAALLAAAPWVPVLRHAVARNALGGLPAFRIARFRSAPDATLSFVDLACGAQHIADFGPFDPWRDSEWPAWHAKKVASEVGRVDGRSECFGAAAMAAVAVGLALMRRTRDLWILAMVLVATSAWTWFRMRADLRDIASRLSEAAIPTWASILPWPWLMIGAAAILLAVAARITRRPPRPPPVDTGIFR